MHKSTEESLCPMADTIGEIKLALQSKSGEKTVWCIVEADDDRNVFAKFMNDAVTAIFMPRDANVSNGWVNVEIIVSEILKREPLVLIFGIRDRDYTKYESNYTCHPNVYLTDNCDIEMMMFAAPSVINGLNDWNAEFSNNIEKCVEPARHFGYLRIYNQLNDFKCDFKSNVKIASVWNQKSRSLYEDWESTLMNKFLDQVGDRGASEEGFKNFVIQNNLPEESWLDICRGHDFIRLLGYMMRKTEFNNAKRIRGKMTRAYSREDFKATKLYQSIKRWADDKGVTVLLD